MENPQDSMNSPSKTYIESGNSLFEQGKLNEAIVSYQKALLNQPDNAIVHNKLGEIYFIQGKVAEAIASVQLALKLQPNLAVAYKNLGNALQVQGKLDGAIRAYNKAVEIEPEFAEAYANIGSILSKKGQLNEAITYFEQALALKPNLAAVHWNLGNALIGLGKKDLAIASWRKAAEYKSEQFSAVALTNQGTNLTGQNKIDTAVVCYERAIAIKPDYILGGLNLGTLWQQQGKWDEAIAVWEKCLEIEPDTETKGYIGIVLQRLGNAFKQQNKIESAINYWEKAIGIQPESVSSETYNDLGTAKGQQGKIEQAIAYYQRAIELKPDYPLALLNLGTLLVQEKELDRAIANFKKAIEVQPDNIEAYNKLGSALLKQEKFESAIAQYQKAIEMQPDAFGAHFNLGVVLLQQEKFESACAAFEKAIDLQSDNAEAYCNLGVAMHRQLKKSGGASLSEFDRAFNTFQKALEINPDLLAAHLCLSELINTPIPGNNSLVHLREAAEKYSENCGETGKLIAANAFINIHLKSALQQIAKEKFLEIEPLIYNRDLTEPEIISLYAHLLFNINYLRDDLVANTKLCKFIGEQYSDIIAKNQPNKQPYRREGELKIGIISAHFRRHSVGWCSGDIIKELSKLTPHLYLYYTGDRQDELTKSFAQAAAKFYQPNKFSNGIPDEKQLRDQILQDELDILIDLDSLTIPLQVQIIHQQPAPVCLSWLGFEAPFTADKNYFLCDAHTHPEGVEQYYREQLIRLPDSFVAVAGFESQQVERKSVRRGLRIAEDQVVYLCIAPAYKLNPDLIKAQIQILKQIPDSLLMYKGHTGDIEEIKSAYRQECEALGIGLHRIRFLPLAKTEEEHRTTYKVADILLDSYPYNGGTHTLEALWFNLPVVTRKGEQYLSRMGYSFLQTIPVDAGIANNWSEYVDWGIKLGKDADLREKIQQQLVQSKQSETLSPLWNPKKFAGDMYAVLEGLLNR